MSHPDYDIQVALRRQDEAVREARAFRLARQHKDEASPRFQLRRRIDRVLVRLGEGADARESARRGGPTAAGRRS